MFDLYKIPLVVSPQPEGGYSIHSPVLGELVTEGDNLEEAVRNIRDALRATLEGYKHLGRSFPMTLMKDSRTDSIWFDHLVEV